MKNIILASAIAFTSIFAAAGQSMAQSASVTIRTDDGPRYYRDRDRPRHYRERDRDRARYVVRDRGRDCFTKKVRTYRNGDLVVRTTRVCR
jgi:Ni/Co efflux regulator RcnB